MGSNPVSQTKMPLEKNVEELKKKVEALPEVFQKRIKKFTMTKENWLEEYGGYEIMCCEEAIKIANFCKTKEKVIEFNTWDAKKQYKKVDLTEGHSGNSFGFAMRLAYHYLNNPDSVILEHGALTPLIGCPEYGCPHPPPEYVIEMLSEEGLKKLRKVIADKG